MGPWCALALLLLVDVSGSVDDKEYALQKQGIVQAFQDERVQRALWQQHTVAIAIAEFDDNTKLVVPWMTITGADADVVALLYAEAPRAGSGSTWVFNALEWATFYMTQAPCYAERQVIDVSGDGAHNGPGPAYVPPPDLIINGLPILGDASEPNLEDWYQENVVHNGFLIVAKDFADFARAIRQKLALEIANEVPH